MGVRRVFGATATAVAVGCLMTASLAIPAGAKKPTPPPPPPSTSIGVATDFGVSDATKAVEFHDQSGALHHLSDLQGKTTLVVPFLTLCPEVCPFTTGNLLKLSAELALSTRANPDIKIVALTVDPTRDTVARLAAYATMINAYFPNLSFWTASPSDTVSIESELGITADVVAPDSPAPVDWFLHTPITYDIDHSDGFYVLNSDLHIRFVSGARPHFVGTLVAALKAYLTPDGRAILKHPYQGWKPADAKRALAYVAGRKL